MTATNVVTPQNSLERSSRGAATKNQETKAQQSNITQGQDSRERNANAVTIKDIEVPEDIKKKFTQEAILVELGLKFHKEAKAAIEQNPIDEEKLFIALNSLISLRRTKILNANQMALLKESEISFIHEMISETILQAPHIAVQIAEFAYNNEIYAKSSMLVMLEYLRLFKPEKRTEANITAINKLVTQLKKLFPEDEHFTYLLEEYSTFSWLAPFISILKNSNTWSVFENLTELPALVIFLFNENQSSDQFNNQLKELDSESLTQNFFGDHWSLAYDILVMRFCTRRQTSGTMIGLLSMWKGRNIFDCFTFQLLSAYKQLSTLSSNKFEDPSYGLIQQSKSEVIKCLQKASHFFSDELSELKENQDNARLLKIIEEFKNGNLWSQPHDQLSIEELVKKIDSEPQTNTTKRTEQQELAKTRKKLKKAAKQGNADKCLTLLTTPRHNEKLTIIEKTQYITTDIEKYEKLNEDQKNIFINYMRNLGESELTSILQHEEGDIISKFIKNKIQAEALSVDATDKTTVSTSTASEEEEYKTVEPIEKTVSYFIDNIDDTSITAKYPDSKDRKDFEQALLAVEQLQASISNGNHDSISNHSNIKALRNIIIRNSEKIEHNPNWAIITARYILIECSASDRHLYKPSTTHDISVEHVKLLGSAYNCYHKNSTHIGLALAIAELHTSFHIFTKSTSTDQQAYQALLQVERQLVKIDFKTVTEIQRAILSRTQILVSKTTTSLSKESDQLESVNRTIHSLMSYSLEDYDSWLPASAEVLRLANEENITLNQEHHQLLGYPDHYGAAHDVISHILKNPSHYPNDALLSQAVLYAKKYLSEQDSSLISTINEALRLNPNNALALLLKAEIEHDDKKITDDEYFTQLIQALQHTIPNAPHSALNILQHIRTLKPDMNLNDRISPDLEKQVFINNEKPRPYNTLRSIMEVLLRAQPNRASLFKLTSENLLKGTETIAYEDQKDQKPIIVYLPKSSA